MLYTYIDITWYMHNTYAPLSQMKVRAQRIAAKHTGHKKGHSAPRVTVSMKHQPIIFAKTNKQISKRLWQLNILASIFQAIFKLLGILNFAPKNHVNSDWEACTVVARSLRSR